MKQENPGLWNRPKMYSLADLAGRVVLSVYVRVACDLAKENEKHYRQAESKQPSQVPSDSYPVNHLAF